MKKKKPRNLLKQYKENLDGQDITVSVIKPKLNNGVNHARRANTSCPNCGSMLTLDDKGLYQCSKDKLTYWDMEFSKFQKMFPEKQTEYLKTISSNSLFYDLYDRWLYSRVTENPADFDCGYTNNVSLPIGSNKVIIPDPCYTSFVEQRLGRKLSEEELRNESELWQKGRRIYPEYRKGAKMIKIPYILLPDEVEVKI